MYIYTIKDNDEPATVDILAFLEANATKTIVTYDGGNVNGIHYTGCIFHRCGKAIRTHFDGVKRQEMSKP